VNARIPSLFVQSARLAPVALAAVLAACGGGNEDTDAASSTVERIVAQSAASPRQQVLATTAATPTTADLFEWAEWKWPTLFPSPVEVERVLGGATFVLRLYGSGIILAVNRSTNQVYALLPTANAQPIALGTIATFATEICAYKPTACGTTPPPPGSYNECVDPNALALPTGFTTRTVYQYTGLVGGEQTVESVVDGPDNFEDQSAIKMRSRITGTNSAEGVTTQLDAELSTFLQKSNGLLNTLGSRDKATITVIGFPVPPTETESKTVYDPPLSNVEFTLQPGQSVTKTTNAVTTEIKGLTPGLVTPYTLQETHTFVRKETIGVLGRTFSTCVYTLLSEGETTTTWYLVGKGIPVRVESPGQVVELKSGTYNGTPL
jgi:hypothetical protein